MAALIKPTTDSQSSSALTNPSTGDIVIWRVSVFSSVNALASVPNASCTAPASRVSASCSTETLLLTSKHCSGFPLLLLFSVWSHCRSISFSIDIWFAHEDAPDAARCVSDSRSKHFNRPRVSVVVGVVVVGEDVAVDVPVKVAVVELVGELVCVEEGDEVPVVVALAVAEVVCVEVAVVVTVAEAVVVPVVDVVGVVVLVVDVVAVVVALVVPELVADVVADIEVAVVDAVEVAEVDVVGVVVPVDVRVLDAVLDADDVAVVLGVSVAVLVSEVVAVLDPVDVGV